ncbi:MAG: DUF3616 domain-containing protein [Pseudomonadota bacterium]
MKLAFRKRAAAVVDDLSAAAIAGKTLFVAGDETASIEVLDKRGSGFSYRDTVDLADFLALPGGKNAEADIEGMAVCRDSLWVLGSHALTRPRPDRADPDDALQRIRTIERQPNRFLLARIPLLPRRGGTFEMSDRGTGMVDAGRRSSSLIKWVSDDAVLASFTALPSKENGFDLEGIAVVGERVFLGLRGPVLRGYAVILEFHLTDGKRGALKARKLEGGRRFRKHLLELDGLGLRDLVVYGDDLLLLTGPTMMAPGPARLYRWHGALTARGSGLVPEAAVSLEADLQTGLSGDNPEAITFLDPETLLVLHDSPAKSRVNRKTGTYTADTLTLR